MPKNGNSPPRPQKWNFQKFFIFVERSPNFASNEPSTTQTLSLSQVMQENVILAYYAQIWKFSPGSQKWNFSKNFHFSDKVFRLRF